MCDSRSKRCRSAFCSTSIARTCLTFIIDEHPQTIALILSHLPPQYGAEIIAGLPSDRQLAVIRRVATMGQTNPEIIQEVERGLEVRMSSVMSQQFEKAGGVPTVAEILNVTDRATERNLLENLAQEDPDLVEEIRRLMFVFEDINKFSGKDIQTMLKNVETSQWAMALKGASEELKSKVLSQYVAARRRHAPRRNGLPRPGASCRASSRCSSRSSTSCGGWKNPATSAVGARREGRIHPVSRRLTVLRRPSPRGGALSSKLPWRGRFTGRDRHVIKKHAMTSIHLAKWALDDGKIAVVAFTKAVSIRPASRPYSTR